MNPLSAVGAGLEVITRLMRRFWGDGTAEQARLNKELDAAYTDYHRAVRDRNVRGAMVARNRIIELRDDIAAREHPPK